MRNPRLTNHMPDARTRAILFLCQMAMLGEYYKHIFREERCSMEAWGTDMRSTINSEPEARPRKEKI